jgi:hypothetical protein
MPKNNWITPELAQTIGIATGEFTASLIEIIAARVRGEDIPNDALEKRIRATLKQETAYKLAKAIRDARGE